MLPSPADALTLPADSPSSAEQPSAGPSIQPVHLQGQIHLAKAQGHVLLIWADPPALTRLTKSAARQLGAALNKAAL